MKLLKDPDLPINLDGKATLSNCIAFLLNNQFKSDVQFHFKNENITFYGHTFIIGLRSSVFNTMFYGPLTMAAENQNVIEIVDISASSFFQMLSFIYTDEVNISAENFCEIMYAAHKYSLNYLEKMCCQFVNEQVDAENCCLYLQQCLIFDNAMTKKCFDTIDKNIDFIISRNLWKDLKEDEMIAIIKRDSLDISEANLFEGVLTWTVDVCEAQGLPSTADDVREKFKLFEMVRFPTMSMKEFCTIHRAYGEFFRPEEIVDIFQYINAEIVSDSLKYSTVKRKRHGN